MSDKTAVLDLVNAWATAEADNDGTRVGELVTDDFAGVGPVGFVLNRKVWTGRFAQGLENRAFAVTEPQVRVYGDAAVVIGVVDQQTLVRGEDNSGKFRISLTAVREDGAWRLANLHLGDLKFPGPPV